MPNEFVASLKGNTNEDPWLVIHAENPAALKSGLQHVIDDAIGALVSEAQAAYRAQISANTTLGAQPVDEPVWATRPAQAAPAVNPAAGAGPSCPHGAMTWKEGTGKASGKPYKGWFCPQRGSDCKPQFV